MVGFNRRFAPLYQQLKAQSGTLASLRMDKHRTDSIGPNDLRFTLLDDYLHVVDTALWLSNGNAQLKSGTTVTNDQGQMVYAEHHFAVEHLQITTSMHRRAGSQRESVQAVTEGALYDITDMREWREEKGNGVVTLPARAGRAPSSSAVSQDAPATLSPACKIRRFLKRPASRPFWRSALWKGSGAMP